jgi:plastocyanin
VRNPIQYLLIAIGLLAVGGLTAACGGDEDTEPITVEVDVDGSPDDQNLAFLAYFPSELSVHAGDTIDFGLVDTGEPHSVTLGTLVDGVLSTASPDDEALFAAVPVMLPAGPGDANQTAANPCFVASGAPPVDTRCEGDQPNFDGTQSFYNSGWLAPQSTFSVTLDDDIETGTYHFVCLLHGSAMSGSFTVVDDDEDVPTPAEVRAAGQAKLDELAEQLQPAVEALATLDAETAMAGSGSPEVQIGLVNQFGPSDLAISVGDAVTWTVLGPHTISFNAPQSANQARVEAPDGSAHINAEAFAPANGPGQPAEGEGGGEPGPPILIDAGEWDGDGFLSSGLIVSFPPQLFQYQVTFTQAGTYTFQCLIHPDMEGTVTVGG